MCHRLDARFFQELAKLPPADVCRRASCTYDPDRRCYRLTAWGRPCEVFPHEAEIRPAPGLPPVSMEFGLVIVFYLLQERDLPTAGEWVSEKDLPGGIGFFQGPHAIPGAAAAARFGADIEKFRRAAQSLAGEPLPMGDAAFRFEVLPRLPVAAIFWAEDEEFPADLRLLFDRSIGERLPLDVIFALAGEVCARLIAAA